MTTFRERLGAGARLREGSAELARRIAGATEPCVVVDDQSAQAYFEARERLALGFGVRPLGLPWDDVPVSERLLTAAALRELLASGELTR